MKRPCKTCKRIRTVTNGKRELCAGRAGATMPCSLCYAWLSKGEFGIKSEMGLKLEAEASGEKLGGSLRGIIDAAIAVGRSTEALSKPRLLADAPNARVEYRVKEGPSHLGGTRMELQRTTKFNGQRMPTILVAAFDNYAEAHAFKAWFEKAIAQ